jgi:redox-regulated HSP33 family molecular chaperone
MTGIILHNGAELPGNFSAVAGAGSQAADSIQGCLQAYTGVLDVSSGKMSNAAMEYGQHVNQTQTALNDTAMQVNQAAQSHHGEVTDLDAGFAGSVGI